MDKFEALRIRVERLEKENRELADFLEAQPCPKYKPGEYAPVNVLSEEEKDNLLQGDRLFLSPATRYMAWPRRQ